MILEIHEIVRGSSRRLFVHGIIKGGEVKIVSFLGLFLIDWHEVKIGVIALSNFGFDIVTEGLEWIKMNRPFWRIVILLLLVRNIIQRLRLNLLGMIWNVNYFIVKDMFLSCRKVTIFLV